VIKGTISYREANNDSEHVANVKSIFR